MFTRPPFPRSKVPPVKPQYIVLFKGDDSDFQGNQSVDIVIDTELDTTGMKAHFRFMDFVQDFDSIPENKTLSLVFPNAKTSEFPLGAADATLRFEDASGKFRTVSNRIHIVVTNSVPEAYDNEDSQSITVTVKGTVTWDMIEGKPYIPTEFPQPSDDAPLMDGEAAAGESTEYSRGDHVHPTDTSRASVEDATLNPIYKGGTPIYSEWVCDPPEATVGWDDTQFDGWYISYGGSSAPAGSSDPNATSLSANFGAVTVIATRTITNFGGYVLGGDEPSAPNHGKYLAGIENIPAVVAPSTAPAAAGKPADAKATGDALAGKQDALTAAQLANIADVPNKADALDVAAALKQKLDGAAAYPAYEDKTYNTGDVVSFEGRLFRCGVDGSTESPSFYPYPSAQWDEVTLDALKQNALSPAQMAAANSGATAAKVEAWDGYAAQIAQNAAQIALKANAADLRYRMVTPGEWTFSELPEGVTDVSLSWNGTTWVYTYVIGTTSYSDALPIRVPPYDGNELSLTFSIGASPVTATRASLPGHLCDRANNLIDATTSNVTLTMPPFVAGKVRDLLVACTIGADDNSEPWSVIFQGQGSEAPSGADEISFKAEGDDAASATFPVPTAAGDWLYSLTERAPHVFAVSLKQLQSVSQQGGV